MQVEWLREEADNRKDASSNIDTGDLLDIFAFI